MLELSGTTPVYLACGVTDLRKSYHGLASIIKLKFNLDPYCLYNGVKTLAFQAKPLGQPHTSKFRKKKCRDTKLEVT